MLDMRRAKFDVHQFAIHGMTKEDKESAQIAHAIKLGAKVCTANGSGTHNRIPLSVQCTKEW